MHPKSIYAREYKVLLALLKAERQRRGLTQEQLGAKMRIRQSVVSRYERGDLRMDIIQLRSWLQAMDCKLVKFIATFEAAL